MDTLRQLLAKLGFTSTPSQNTPPVAYTTNTSPVAYTMNNHPYGPAQLQYQSQPLYSAQVFPQGVQGLPQGAGHNVAPGVHGLPQGVQFGVTGSQPLQGVQGLSQGVQFVGSQPGVSFGPGMVQQGPSPAGFHPGQLPTSGLQDLKEKGNMGSTGDQQKHFVLVHGACHGAWSWFKLKPLLEAAGHRVSALDLSASGTNTKVIQEVATLSDYTMPLLDLMATIPKEEKVVLVGHSLGGMNIALAMEKFPEKVSVGVFLSAFMPDYEHISSYVLDQYNERTPAEDWLDTQFLPFNAENECEHSMFFGPKFMSSKLYQLCSKEVLELGLILIRPGSLYLKDLRGAKYFTEGGYGSVRRVFVVCDEDQGIKKDFQQWMIDNNPVNEVKELKGVDHMAMLCDPKQLSACVHDIALQYA
ncbi:methyl esterase 1 [Artemisia annua]|uniref:Methyl esterase 1 n=1 Tax=Artemisia annua TaxID=35608 RepID=A0A2U1LMZ6_ARTAN|nr:methyl esterase 1 [Artemisia annua]